MTQAFVGQAFGVKKTLSHPWFKDVMLANEGHGIFYTALVSISGDAQKIHCPTVNEYLKMSRRNLFKPKFELS